MHASAHEHLSGAIERIAFHRPDSGFCVLRVKVRGARDLVTVIGSAASVTPGELLNAEGIWHTDRQHGLQFKANDLRVVPPSTADGIARSLGSGMVKGIGPHVAKTLVKAFGDAVFDIIEQHPERLLELAGIGPKRQPRVTAAWSEQKAIRAIMVFLQSHGVGTSRAVRIDKTDGDEAVEKVRENPYRLALDIHGIGFKIADAIGARIGIPHDAPMRAQAGVHHTLQEIASRGHCAAWHDALTKQAATLLEVPALVVEQAIAAELDEDRLIAERIDERPALFLPPLQRAEQGIANAVAHLQRAALPWSGIDAAQALAWVEARTGLALSPSQRAAVRAALASKLTIVTGGPGVGKTTVVDSILRILGAHGVTILACAPTGRAAKRLAESTGLDAKTIHRLLEFSPKNGGFQRHQDHPLEADLVVVDEVSMVDTVLMNQLLRAVPRRAAVLLVGDVDQLPSVGPGAVLADLIGSEQVATVRLTEIFRQAASSRIIVNAHRINAGKLPEAPDVDHPDSDFYRIRCNTPEEIQERLLRVVTERIPQRFGLDPVRDVQVLTPMHRGGLGTQALNVALQAALNPHAQPRIERFGSTDAPGDKVLQRVNNDDKEVFNGDIGFIETVDLDEGILTIDFEGRSVTYETGELDEVALAYATSIHKSQGSEYPAVVIPLAMQHFMLLQRNLLDTAVTRGKRLVVLIAQPRALAMAIKQAGSSQRLTKLRQRLQGAIAAAT